MNKSKHKCPYCNAPKENEYGLCLKCHRFPNPNQLNQNTMDTIKANIVVMSHLSDAQEILDRYSVINVVQKLIINNHINFAKYVIMQCNGDLKQEIDTDQMFDNFLLKYSAS